MTDAAGDSAGREWQPWFAWYPVASYGFSVGPRWYRRRWLWLCRVEWIEGHTIGDFIYRLPGDSDA